MKIGGARSGMRMQHKAFPSPYPASRFTFRGSIEPGNWFWKGVRGLLSPRMAFFLSLFQQDIPTDAAARTPNPAHPLSFLKRFCYNFLFLKRTEFFLTLLFINPFLERKVIIPQER